jgi:hypothetical protein
MSPALGAEKVKLILVLVLSKVRIVTILAPGEE